MDIRSTPCVRKMHPSCAVRTQVRTYSASCLTHRSRHLRASMHIYVPTPESRNSKIQEEYRLHAAAASASQPHCDICTQHIQCDAWTFEYSCPYPRITPRTNLHILGLRAQHSECFRACLPNICCAAETSIPSAFASLHNKAGHAVHHWITRTRIPAMDVGRVRLTLAGVAAAAVLLSCTAAPAAGAFLGQVHVAPTRIACCIGSSRGDQLKMWPRTNEIVCDVTSSVRTSRAAIPWMVSFSQKNCQL